MHCFSRLSEILQAEEVETHHDPRRQESVLGRVRRLLSVQEPPDLMHARPSLKRHSSDIPSFFPFVPDHRVYPGVPEDIAVPHKPPLHPGVPPHAPSHAHVDTLATLQEVNSAPSSPDTMVRPPLFQDVPEVVITIPSLGSDHNSSTATTASFAEVETKDLPKGGVSDAPTYSIPGEALKPGSQVEGNPSKEASEVDDVAACYTPTDMGPRRFRWTSPTERMRKRQLSFQLSRTGSRSSLHGVPRTPSPRLSGRRRAQHVGTPSQSPLGSPQQEENPIVPHTDTSGSQGLKGTDTAQREHQNNSKSI